MRAICQRFPCFLALALLVTGCASPGATPTQPSGTETSGVRKHIVAAVMGDPPSLVSRINTGGVGIPGWGEVGGLVNRGLTLTDDSGARRPLHAEAVPTTENGLWTLFPDGRMETRWVLKAGAQWHDGTAFTTDDLLFTAAVDQDNELPISRDPAYALIESIEALDARTVRVTWKKPYVDADDMFSSPPLPKHLLERVYRQDKANFLTLPYWTEQFVGTGPFKLKEWAAGSHVIVEANDRYVLGRPKVDQIEVKFIPDTNTVVANVLSGAVELTFGRGLSLEQALTIRDRWTAGSPEIALASRIVMYPQFMNPSPAAVTDVRFRRALLHALDRQEMADTLNAGYSSIAHIFLAPREREYPEIASSIVKYDFDVRRAAQLLEEAGYTRGPDGALRDRGSQRLSVEIRTSQEQDIHLKAMASAANYWERAGLATEQVVIPPQRRRDREYVQTFPSFLLYRQGSGLDFLKRLRISETPLPENDYVGNNNSRYLNQEFDAVLDRVFITIPMQQRMNVVRQAVQHLTDQVLLLELFYDTQPVVIGSRLVNVRKPGSASILWDVHEWDVK